MIPMGNKKKTSHYKHLFWATYVFMRDGRTCGTAGSRARGGAQA